MEVLVCLFLFPARCYPVYCGPVFGSFEIFKILILSSNHEVGIEDDFVKSFVVTNISAT